MTDAGPLFAWTPPKERAFDGRTYDPVLDCSRLTDQLLDVFELMKDGRWRTLSEIADHTRHPPQSVSARLRDLRKAKYGAHEVKGQRVGGGSWQYQLVVKVSA